MSAEKVLVFAEPPLETRDWAEPLQIMKWSVHWREETSSFGENQSPPPPPFDGGGAAGWSAASCWSEPGGGGSRAAGFLFLHNVPCVRTKIICFVSKPEGGGVLRTNTRLRRLESKVPGLMPPPRTFHISHINHSHPPPLPTFLFAPGQNLTPAE